MAHRSQSQRILWLLAASFPSWTPAPELGKISLQFCTRIFELRRAGWLIENRIEQEGTKKPQLLQTGLKAASSQSEASADAKCAAGPRDAAVFESSKVSRSGGMLNARVRQATSAILDRHDRPETSSGRSRGNHYRLLW